jgi:hypothetical protein
VLSNQTIDKSNLPVLWKFLYAVQYLNVYIDILISKQIEKSIRNNVKYLAFILFECELKVILVVCESNTWLLLKLV